MFFYTIYLYLISGHIFSSNMHFFDGFVVEDQKYACVPDLASAKRMIIQNVPFRSRSKLSKVLLVVGDSILSLYMLG